MSVVVYNGCTLPYPLATQFAMEALGDDASDTDWCYTRFDIAYQCFINTDYLSELIPGANPADFDSPADIVMVLWQTLMARRKLLTIDFNGAPLIPDLAGVQGTVDARNGPIPKRCHFAMMTDTTYIMTYELTAHYWLNLSSVGGEGDTNEPGNPVLFNRWTESVEIDENNRSTRTREGTFRIRSDNAQGATADTMRTQMAVVSVPTGFLRLPSTYTVSKDGLSIDYRVTDKEVYKMPPKPAFTAVGDFTEIGTKGGAWRTGVVSLRLTGDNATSQADLIKAAVSIATRKLAINGAQGLLFGTVGASVPWDSRLRVGMYDNYVEFSLSVLLMADRQRLNGLEGFNGTALTFTPGTDGEPVYTPAYRDRGTASILLQAAAFYDPSLTGVVLGAGTLTGNNPLTRRGGGSALQMTAGAQPGTTGANPE